jgi:hypothetical protein
LLQQTGTDHLPKQDQKKLNWLIKKKQLKINAGQWLENGMRFKI